MKHVLAVTLLVQMGNQTVFAQHPCSELARTQAKKLLEFHYGQDDRIEIDKSVKVLKPIKDPAGRRQFDVLEVWGHIYKGEYRMRFIYEKVSGEYELVGQEVRASAVPW